ncbi:hypothetical protein ACP70R_026333 [Stipagrostis hirtigluma subsp. patula]
MASGTFPYAFCGQFLSSVCALVAHTAMHTREATTLGMTHQEYAMYLRTGALPPRLQLLPPPAPPMIQPLILRPVALRLRAPVPPPFFRVMPPAMAPAQPVVPAHMLERQRPPAPAPPQPIPNAGDGNMGMELLAPNPAFWEQYRQGGSRPEELDFLGLADAPPAQPPAVPDGYASGPSSPTFHDWIVDNDDSTADMEV